MNMGPGGMGDMGEMRMDVPDNSIPMVGAQGPYDYITMGGMFTILKVRDGLTSYDDPGWYENPPAKSPALPAPRICAGIISTPARVPAQAWRARPVSFVRCILKSCRTNRASVPSAAWLWCRRSRSTHIPQTHERPQFEKSLPESLPP